MSQVLSLNSDSSIFKGAANVRSSTACHPAKAGALWQSMYISVCITTLERENLQPLTFNPYY